MFNLGGNNIKKIFFKLLLRIFIFSVSFWTCFTVYAQTVVLDDFTEDNWWADAFSEEFLSWDTNDYVNNKQSLKISTGGLGEGASIYLEKNIDFSLEGDENSESYLEVDVKTEDVANLSRLYMTLYSDTQQGLYREAGLERTGRKNLPDSEWTTLKVALQSFQPKYNETIESIGYDFHKIKFRISDNGQPATVRLGGIRAVTIPKKSYVIMTFDDGYKSTVAKALPIMEQYNIKGTAFNIRENIGISDRYMSLGDIQILENKGWTNGLHGQSPNGAGWANLSEEELDEYLESSINFWQNNNINSGMDVLSYPNGNFGGDHHNYIYNTVAKYAKVARGTNVEMTEPSASPTDLLTLRPGLDMYLRQSIPPEDIIMSLDRLAIEGGLGILVTHRLVEDNPMTSEYSINQFVKVVKELDKLRSSQGINIITMAEYRDLMLEGETENGDENEDGDDEDESVVGECMDWDGDGWGWDGEKGCRMNGDNEGDDDEDENEDENEDGDDEDESVVGECIDWDGDGWGWDGEKGCKMSVNENEGSDDGNNNDDNDNNDNGDENGGENEDEDSGDENDNQAGECVDWDGDGWGWDRVKGCKMSDDNGNNEDEDEERECRETQDTAINGGWGWDGEKGCKMTE